MDWQGRLRRQWRGRVATALIAALLLGACSATVTPSPSPSPSPTPSPSPSPTPDVAKVFVAAVSDPKFSTRSTVGGTLQLGTISVDLKGTQDFSGKDSQSTLTAGNGAPQASLTVQGTSYKRTGDGPWIGQAAAPTKDLSSFLATLATLQDVGVEAKAGRQLHHLRAPPDVKLDPAVLGFNDPSMTDVRVTVDFFAEADGTPAVFTFTFSWKQTIGGTAVEAKGTFDFVLTDVGKPVEIRAPDVIWTTFTSSRFGYSFARPKDWETTETDPRVDTFRGPNGAIVVIARDDLSVGLTLNTYTTAVIATNKADFGAPASNDAYTAFSVPGRLLAYDTTINGQPYHVLEVAIVSGKYGYQLILISPAGTTSADRVLLDQLVSTLQLAA